MVEVKIENARYTYIHDLCKDYSPQTLDTHHVLRRRNAAIIFLIYLSALLLNAYAFRIFLLKEKSIFIVIWSLVISVLLVKLLIWKPVVKESIIIMPGFGVQFETLYGSGRINRLFVPVGKILKPVLNECVTPVTCYWCLSLLVRGEDELMLVFKEFYPPIKMLVPIWNGLCAAIDTKESSKALEDVSELYLEKTFEHHKSLYKDV